MQCFVFTPIYCILGFAQGMIWNVLLAALRQTNLDFYVEQLLSLLLILFVVEVVIGIPCITIIFANWSNLH